MGAPDRAARCAALALAAALGAGPAAAHPLGNATVNRQAALVVAPGQVRLDFRMDLAEIPSLAAEAEADSDGDGAVGEGEWRAQARRWAAAAGAGLHLSAAGPPQGGQRPPGGQGGQRPSVGVMSLSAAGPPQGGQRPPGGQGGQRPSVGAAPLAAGGQALPLRLERVDHELARGEAGLPLLRLHARFTASLPTGATGLALADDFRPAERGWREIWVAAAGGVQLSGAVARADRSQGLRHYPEGGAVPDERRVEVAVALPAAPPARATSFAPAPAADTPAPAQDTPTPGPDSRPARLPAPEPAAEAASAAPPTVAPSPAGLFRLGIHHILTGFDHLAFLAGLLLISRGWRRAAGVVTAFTLAHSLTLLLAARGLVAVPPVAVESAIALSVAWVGALAVAGRGGAHGFGLAFAFGLVHGLGFAGALAETLGDGQMMLLPLLAFNLGIEACQLALVAVALGLAGWLRGQGRLAAGLHQLASLMVTGGGLVWFVARVAA